MARLNLHDRMWADPRFDALKIMVGNEFVAIGIMVKAFKLAQEFWGDNQKLIPIETWELYPFSYLEKSGLAERTEAGVYVKGSQENFDWLYKKRTAGRAGGLKSAQIRQDKYGTTKVLKLDKNEAPHEADMKHSMKHCFTNDEAQSNPLSLSLSLNTYTSNKPSDNKAKKHDESLGMAGAIVTAWNSALTGVLPPVHRMTDKRKKQITAQLKKYPDMDHWQQAFEKVRDSDFLTGRSGHWKANFDWVLNENNRIKIIEGNYENKTKQNVESERRWLK